MSKKKSNTKGSNTAILDAPSVHDEKNEHSGSVRTKEVNLKDYMKNAPFSFNKKNYKMLLLGLALNIIGFILMIGGAAEDPSTFDPDELFSRRRITLAPILIVAGYIVIFYSIMKKPKSTELPND